jgi:arylsulfatase
MNKIFKQTFLISGLLSFNFESGILIAQSQEKVKVAIKPNILWICTDQQRYNTIHSLNNSEIQTPNLDKLCKMGVAFTKAYCQSPVCTPSRASFLTGLYPSSVHQTRNGNVTFPANERVQLISKHLADAGYDCALIGKLHIASPWNGLEKRVDDGYREFHHSLSPGQGYKNGNEYMDWVESTGHLNDVFDMSKNTEGLRARRGSIPYQKDISPQYHQTTWCVNKAIDFINEKRTGPWMISVNIFDPHPPFDAPLSYENRYNIMKLTPPLFKESDLTVQEKLKPVAEALQYSGKPTEKQMHNIASYYGMITLIDEQIGRILDLLEKTNQLENTIIIFNSDHGEMLGDHGLTGKGCRFYEGAVRVPFIIAWPGHFLKGKTFDCLTELTDIAPTLAEVAGIQLDWVHGISLIPILTGSKDGSINHDHVRCEYYDALDMESGNAISEKKSIPDFATMYRNKQFKLVTYHNLKYGELYDLINDSDEFINLWENPDYTEIKCELIKASYDASIQATDPGPKRIGRF